MTLTTLPALLNGPFVYCAYMNIIGRQLSWLNPMRRGSSVFGAVGRNRIWGDGCGAHQAQEDVEDVS